MRPTWTSRASRTPSTATTAARGWQPVLETLEYLARETRVWLELTTLLIPGANDAAAELEALTAWVADHLGQEVPLHFSAFHPDHRLLDRPPTPLATLQRARAIAREQGPALRLPGQCAEPGRQHHLLPWLRSRP